AEDIAVGDVHLHPLLFFGVLLVGDALAQLLLLGLQVGFGQLVDGFVQKRRATHGRLADGELENFIRRFAGEDFLQRMLYQALGQHLRGVVRGGLFPGAASQAVDKGALGILARVAAKQALGVGVLADGADRDEVCGFQLIEFGILFFVCCAAVRLITAVEVIIAVGILPLFACA